MLKAIFLKRIIKNLVISFGYYSGIFDLHRLVCSKKGQVPIVVYHRIVEDCSRGVVDSSFKLRGLTVTAHEFEEQIRYLNKNYKIISLADYIEKKNQQESLCGCAVITFDDGFKDFLTLGWPALMKYQAPATVFVFKSALEMVYWQHRVYFILDAAKKDMLTFNVCPDEAIQINLKSNEKKYQTIINLIKLLKNKPISSRGRIISELAKELEVNKEPQAKQVYLDYDDLASLVRQGVSLGGHSVGHGNLAELNSEEIKEEIYSSIDFIRSLTKQKDITFALPFGAGNEDVIRELQAQGCLCSFISASGLNSREEDNFKLKRIAALESPISEFAYNVSGAEKFLSLFLGYKKQS
jgi:peptidoglycan/xylan/chitin deacetylase (PgdA/CDA1 family)